MAITWRTLTFLSGFTEKGCSPAHGSSFREGARRLSTRHSRRWGVGGPDIQNARLKRNGSPFFHHPLASATAWTFLEYIVRSGLSSSVVMRERFAETPTSPGGMRFAAQTAPVSAGPGPK